MISRILGGNLRRALLGATGLRLASHGLLFLVAILVARALGPASLGVYAELLAIAAMLAIPVTAGLPVLLLRETAKARNGADASTWRGLVRAAFGVTLPFSLFGLLILQLIGWRTPQPPGSVTIALLLLIILPLGWSRLATGLLQGAGQPLQSQWPEDIARPILFAGGLLLCWFIFDHISLTAAVATYGASYLVNAIIVAFLAWRSTAGIARGGRATFAWRSWLGSVTGLSAFNGLAMLMASAEILLVAASAAATDVGQYRVALQGIAVMALVQAGSSAVIAARLADARYRGDSAALRQVARSLNRLLVPVAMAFFLLFWLAGEAVITALFGPSYRDSAPLLLILALGQLANAATGIGRDLLLVTGHERSALLAQLWGAAILIIGAAVLAPRFGALGVAIAAASSTACSNIGYAVACHFRLGFSPDALSMLRGSASRDS